MVTRISDLTEKSTFNKNDLLLVTDIANNASKKATIDFITQQKADITYVDSVVGNMSGTIIVNNTTTIDNADTGKLIELTGLSSYTVRLPSPKTSQIKTGSTFIIWNNSTSNKTIAINNVELEKFYGDFSGANSFVMSPNMMLTAISDGSNWIVSISASNFTIGVNQTWQNMGPYRSSGATYTNTTGRPITVMVSFSYAVRFDGQNYAYVYMNGVQVAQFDIITYSYGTDTTFSFIVPNNNTYALSAPNGIITWYELR